MVKKTREMVAQYMEKAVCRVMTTHSGFALWKTKRKTVPFTFAQVMRYRVILLSRRSELQYIIGEKSSVEKVSGKNSCFDHKFAITSDPFCDI